jgi:hypothetical protein
MAIDAILSLAAASRYILWHVNTFIGQICYSPRICQAGFQTDICSRTGIHICSTINCNPKSLAMAIFGAKNVMRWPPKGTHEWNKFITPDELFCFLEQAGMTLVDRKGFVFNFAKFT